jgi:hypothetical protein
MRPRPIAEYLTCFRQDVEGIPEEFEPQPSATAIHEPKIDSDALLEDARLQGLIEGTALAKVDAEARFNEERMVFERRLEDERTNWAREEGDRLAQLIENAMRDLEASIGDAVTRILKPFVREALHRKMVSELVVTINTLVKCDNCSLIEVMGREDLLHELRLKLTAFQSIEFIQTDSPEVTVIANQTFIESQLAAWAEQIESLSE